MSDPLEESSEPPAKRRKVRKGTRSCWECRRRKIKCQFDSPEDAICIGCKQRGTMCRSQEFADDNAPEPGHKSDPPLARRLDRLEQMMERLVDKIVPDDDNVPGPASSQLEPQQARRSLSGSSYGSAAIERKESSVDVLDTSAASEGPIAALLAMRHESVQRRGQSAQSGHVPTPALPATTEYAAPIVTAIVTPQKDTSRPVTTSTGGPLLPPLNKHFWVCNTLRTVIPPQATVDTILAASPGTPYVVAICYSEDERREGRPEFPSSLSTMPPLTAHPLSLAKRALQILICIQQLPPDFDWDGIETDTSMTDTINRLSNTATLVTSNDELMGYAEGIECLILQGSYQTNGGNLRKAWITARRALSLAQMMCIDKGHSVAFRSCDPDVNPSRRTSVEGLWFKVVYMERYLSLLLGLSIGSQGIEMLPTNESSSSIDRLQKAHATLSARIGDRNASQQKDLARRLGIYALTQEIDLELEAAAKSVPAAWWDEPRFDPFADQDILWDATAKLLVQMHHFTLVILLHVPYMLRDPGSPRYDFSKCTCVNSARDVLSRFFAYRMHSVSAYSCRQVDYAGLIAAMTLCLSYLSKRRSEIWDHERVLDDISLISRAKSRMQLIARVGGDQLSSGAVGIIDQLIPIVERAAGDMGASRKGKTPRDVHFNVPFMGRISIKLPGDSPVASGEGQGGHRRHPSSATGALERMAIASPSRQQRGSEHSLENDITAHSDEGLLQFAPYDDQSSLHPLGTDMPRVDQQPDLMAGGEDWALQGVDAAYWSLFDGVEL